MSETEPALYTVRDWQRLLHAVWGYGETLGPEAVAQVERVALEGETVLATVCRCAKLPQLYVGLAAHAYDTRTKGVISRAIAQYEIAQANVGRR